MNIKIKKISLILALAVITHSGADDATTQPATPEMQLVTEAGKGNLDTVKSLLDQGVSVNSYADENNMTPLWNAARNGQTEMVNFLLDKGADVNLKAGRYGNLKDAQEKGSTPLFAAIRMRVNLKKEPAKQGVPGAIIKMLIDKGADVNMKLSDGSTPLGAAASTNSIPLLKLLTRRGARVADAPDALKNAIGRALVDSVKFLKDHGANMNIQITSHTMKRGKNGSYDYVQETLSLKDAVKKAIKEGEESHHDFEKNLNEKKKIAALLEKYN